MVSADAHITGHCKVTPSAKGVSVQHRDNRIGVVHNAFNGHFKGTKGVSIFHYATDRGNTPVSQSADIVS